MRVVVTLTDEDTPSVNVTTTLDAYDSEGKV